MNVLFICNQHKHRSKTAEELFREQFETRSGGLYNEKPVTHEALQWAETIVVMEEEQRSELVKRFPILCMQKRLLCLDIPDRYSYQQPELVTLLERKVHDLF